VGSLIGMSVRWRCALSGSLVAVAQAVLCASAPAAPTCDVTAVRQALARTASAINSERPQLLARTYELFPTKAGAVSPPPYALRITRPIGDPMEGKHVTELLYAPGAKDAKLLRALRHLSQLGHWSVGDDIAVGHAHTRVVGITAEFFVVKGASRLRYYGKGGFDCQTGRIVILAPLRQRGRA
jgi:hypothetical protein